MKRADLEHVIRAAAAATGEYEFVIIGNQSILGPIPHPPDELTMSMEADIYPLNAEEKADVIDGAMGEGSQFQDTFGYYAQGVDSTTAVLPEGWKDRLHRVQNAGTGGYLGYCLDVIDLFMSKLAAHREKDREFNMALLRLGYVRTEAALGMVGSMPVDAERKQELRRRIRRMVRMLKDRAFLRARPIPGRLIQRCMDKCHTLLTLRTQHAKGSHGPGTSPGTRHDQHSRQGRVA